MDRNEGRPPDAVRTRRVTRFTEAFARIAPNKRFEGVETVAGEHRVMFTEDGFRTPLADLSTGEKQAIFRGGFLLRRAEELPGAVVLIDEPEWMAWLETCNLQADPWLDVLSGSVQGYPDGFHGDMQNGDAGDV